MTDPTPWQTDRPWQIVRADLELAHVFMPMSSFKFEPVPGSDGKAFTIEHTNQAPHPDCFGNTVLRAVGSSHATFEKIAARKTLPLYGRDTASVYTDISVKVAKYMDQDPEVQRLEGIIRVPCHAHGAQLPKDAAAGHAPFWVKTLIHVYQFSKVVNGDRPLLLIRAPLSPFCPMNGDGTAAGIA
jgi:hypothetical protein